MAEARRARRLANVEINLDGLTDARSCRVDAHEDKAHLSGSVWAMHALSNKGVD